jgi:hypothetical protein
VLALERSNMRLTDETWNQIIDEESQTMRVEAPYIRRVSRRSIERVLGSIPEQGLTDKDLVTLEAIKNRADREYPASIGNQGAWLWVMSAVSGILSSHPAPAPGPHLQVASILEPGALTDEQWDTILVVLANAIRWSWVPTTTVMHMKAELARRPAPAPAPQQDDAAVRKESK